MESNSSMSAQKWAFHMTRILNAAFSGQERFPVDVKSLAKEYSHQRYPNDPITLIKGVDLPKFEGGLFKAPPGKKGWGILYNNAIASQGRINYTLAHEFGHYLMHRVDFPEGIQCGEQDVVRWDSEYGQIEHQANVFAANLLMPLDDYRKQIKATAKIDLDTLGWCAERYGVSLTAAILRWLELTIRRAMIVVSRDSYVLWARSSKSAYKSGFYFKTNNSSAIPVPTLSLAATSSLTNELRLRACLPENIWFSDECEETIIVSDLYDFTISVIQWS